MTGYARVQQQTHLGDLTISLRSVNHRALDFHFHQSSEFFLFENAVRGLLKQQMSRGHVEVRIGITRTAAASAEASYNREIAARYVSAFRKAAAEFRISGEPDLNAVFRLPGAFGSENGAAEIEQTFEPAVLAAVAQCAAELNLFRAREGAQLCQLLREEAEAIQEIVARMKEIRAVAAPEIQKRLLERLESILGAAAIEPRRLVEEAAILADRSDIQEELTRLEIHTEQLLAMLAAGGELGKKIDFLLQEMNRETNTVLSKTSGLGESGLTMTDLGLAAKAHIEKIREQALNIE